MHVSYSSHLRQKIILFDFAHNNIVCMNENAFFVTKKVYCGRIRAKSYLTCIYVTISLSVSQPTKEKNCFQKFKVFELVNTITYDKVGSCLICLRYTLSSLFIRLLDSLQLLSIFCFFIVNLFELDFAGQFTSVVLRPDIE